MNSFRDIVVELCGLNKKEERRKKKEERRMRKMATAMTSLQFTQAQGLGYTRDMYRVPLSIQTYDSVIKVHGMVLASSPGHFSPPHGLEAYDLAAIK